MAEVLVQLNDNWRVADDPPQWAIEQRVGNASVKDKGWRARKFIRTQEHLLRRVVEMCGDVDRAAIETIRSWPHGYVTWKVVKLQVSAGPENAPYSAVRTSKDPKPARSPTHWHLAAKSGVSENPISNRTPESRQSAPHSGSNVCI